MQNTIWKSLAISQTGPRHIRTNLPNQDAVIAKKFVWGEVISVSDGVGSRSLSQIGSAQACVATIKLAQYLSNSVIIHSKQQILYLFHAYWLSLLDSHNIEDCATTCLFAMRINQKIYIAMLGDGLITILQKDKRIQFIEQHDLNGFANMTCSLNEQFNMDQWNFLIIDSHDVNMICLCTDGISEDIQMSQRENFFRDLYDVYKLQTIRKIKCDIRKWLKNWGVKNHQDDKSIAILMKV